MAEAKNLQAEAKTIEDGEARGRALDDFERELEESRRGGDPRAPGAGGSGDAVGAPGGMSYREAFHALMIAGGDRTELAPEARAVLDRGQPAQEVRAQTAGTSAAGGYLVPEEAMTQIVRAMIAWGPMWDDGFATVLNVPGVGALPVPGVNDTAKTAEVTATEGDPLADDGGKDAVFTRSDLSAYMIDTEWLRVSYQLAQSGMVGMESLLADLLGERLGRKANALLTTGTGSGQAQGIVTGASAGVTVAGVAAVTADELIGLYHAVNAAYRRSPKFRFMFNDNTLGSIHKLKDGQGNYLISEAPDGQGQLRIGGVRAPYAINDDMADMGASNASIIAGDMSKYIVRKSGGVLIGTDRGKDFWPGFGIAGVALFDGLVADSTAIKKLAHPAT
jgi:HK97 family phage major capsid protein